MQDLENAGPNRSRAAAKRLPDTLASIHTGTLRHRSQDTSTPKTWYETLRHECRDRGKAGTL